ERLNPGRPLGSELDLYLDHAALPLEPPPAVRGRVELRRAPGGPEIPDALADQGDPALPFGERGILGHIGREQALGDGVVPGLQQLFYRVPGRQRLRPRTRS